MTRPRTRYVLWSLYEERRRRRVKARRLRTAGSVLVGLGVPAFILGAFLYGLGVLPFWPLAAGSAACAAGIGLQAAADRLERRRF